MIDDHQYTVAVFLAAFMCAGAAIGFHFWILVMLFTVMYSKFLAITSKTMSKEFAERKSMSGPDNEMRMKALRRNAEILAIQWSETRRSAFRGNKKAEQIAVDLCQKHNIDYNDPYVSYATPKATKALMLFQSIDLDDNGEISFEELEIFLMGFGVVNVAKEAMKLLTLNDEDNSLTIDLQEFQNSFEVFYTYEFDTIMNLIKESNDVSTTRNVFESMAPVESIMHHSLKVLKEFGAAGCPFAQPSVASKKQSKSK